METYKVWLEGDHEEWGNEIEDYCAEDAAIKYVEEDYDGQADGIYFDEQGFALRDLKKEGKKVHVKCPDGAIKSFFVGCIDLEPVYGAVEAS